MKCERCGKQTNIHIMSMFNTQDICMACKAAEEKDPRYQEASAADEAAIRAGNYNFPGIGITPESEYCAHCRRSVDRDSEDLVLLSDGLLLHRHCAEDISDEVAQ